MNKIYARQCEIKEIDKDLYKEFLFQNHKQKYAKANIRYGLFFKDELMMLMSFDKPRFNKNYQWEIIRECSKKDYQIIGGTSRLWKYFLEHKNCFSCICYSYPHKNKFTSHYVEHCNFKNIKKCKPEKKVYFEGIWKGKIKRIDKSILEKHGVDRLLKTKQGQDRSNEQILLDLGFEKKYEDGLSPQIDIYYPFSVLYRIDDLNDKSFYIGMTENKNSWENGYKGSGTDWNKHLKKYPNHKYERTILKKDFKTPKQARDAEYNEIKKYTLEVNGQKIIKTKGKMINSYLRKQGVYTFLTSEGNACKECGGLRGNHKKSCSQVHICEECGALKNHKKTCSKYKTPKKCDECGCERGHFSFCSEYKVKHCSECNTIHGHKKWCSQVKKCLECGLTHGNHKKTCSQYKEFICEECGGKSKQHFKTCSKYKKRKKYKNWYKKEKI